MFNYAKDLLPELSLRIAVPAFGRAPRRTMPRQEWRMSKSEVMRIFANDLAPENLAETAPGEAPVEAGVQEQAPVRPKAKPGSVAEQHALRAALYPDL
ncbi:hypothetical protein IV417_03020 [Alphaproteobacteria bacterium KMM 3653]|uniref:Uncharacterized protein n=1 Tax=Harenicola maris TaxID=2841044 RepID=A0AAP2CKZ2_9RHOB|nr:hypothetical protein [Harenicola maris]